MIKVTINSFINTLYEVISNSPTTFISLIIGIIFLIAMIISVRKYKKIEKPLFVIGWIFIIVFIIFKYSNYLTALLDNFINNVFMQIFFPNFATYIVIIAFTNFIFLFTILNNNSKTSDKIINSLFFAIIIFLLFITLDHVSKNNINIYEKISVYNNETLLILIESTTITFVSWIIVIISKFAIRKLIKKSDDKVKKKFEDNSKTNNIIESNIPIDYNNNINNVEKVQENSFISEPNIPINSNNNINDVEKVQENGFISKPNIPIDYNNIGNDNSQNSFSQSISIFNSMPDSTNNISNIDSNINNKEKDIYSPVPSIFNLNPNDLFNNSIDTERSHSIDTNSTKEKEIEILKL